MQTKKNAFITGACGGIGRALVNAFANSGYRIIASDLYDKGPGSGESEYITIDLNLYAADTDYAAKINTSLNSLLNSNYLDVIINNAAVQILGHVGEITRSDWSKSFNVNLNAPFFLTQALLNKLEGARGSVINISSIHARLTKKNFLAYSTTKAALSGLTRAMAVDIGSKVRVNAIEIAAIDTEMLRSGFAGSIGRYSKLLNYHPTGEIGKPEDVARYALFMSEQSNGFLNGSCITIDGGISSCLHDPDQFTDNC